MSELYSPLLERAIRTASEFHQSQPRKGSSLPYISHPAAVLLILQRAGIDDERILAAAVLHDTVEDTACTFEFLEERFPPEVVAWVRETSEQKIDAEGVDRSWLDRKREHLAHASRATPEARAIILADKFHNLFSMLYDLQQGESIWKRFNASAEHVLWYNREMIAAISGDDPRIKPLQQAAADTLARLIELTGIEPAAPDNLE
jgi:guanosine-3',5'-bis(diphosphate) 3'-pyrophosphohydrolase